MANQTERAELHKTIWKIANDLKHESEEYVKRILEGDNAGKYKKVVQMLNI